MKVKLSTVREPKMQEKLYTLSEARKALNDIPTTSFYRLVENGKIRRVVLPGRKQALYPKADIDRLLGESSLSIEPQDRTDTEPPEIVVDWMTPKDLPALLALDMEAFDEELIGNVSLYYSWWKRNPETCLMAFEEGKRDRVLAQITLLPLKEETILSILRGERGELEIKPEDIETYTREGEYTLLVENAVVRPNHSAAIGPVMHRWAEFWCSQWPQVKIRRIYAQTVSTAGLFMVKKMYFGPLYDIAEDAYVLDLKHPNPSKFVQGFQQCVEQKEVLIASGEDG